MQNKWMLLGPGVATTTGLATGVARAQERPCAWRWGMRAMDVDAGSVGLGMMVINKNEFEAKRRDLH